MSARSKSLFDVEPSLRNFVSSPPRWKYASFDRCKVTLVWFKTYMQQKNTGYQNLLTSSQGWKYTWIASTVLLSDSLTTLCFLANSSLYLPTSLTMSFSLWAICNWSWATFSQEVLSNCHKGVNVHSGPTFGAPFVLVVALLAAAMLVDEPHCLASLPNCLLYDSSSEDLGIQA